MDVLKNLNQLGNAENFILWQTEDSKTRVDLNDLRRHLSAIHQKLAQEKAQNWLLYAENPFHFCVGFLVLLGLKKNVIICANKQAGWLNLVEHRIDAVLSAEDLGLIKVPNVDLGSSPEPDYEWWPHFDGFEELSFLTSGSTGEPKFIPKQLRALTNELGTLVSVFPKPANETVYCASISFLHIYGLLFGLLLPLANRCRSLLDPITFPEQLQSLAQRFKSLVFISSPAFLSRLDLNLPPLKFDQVFSSGGHLDFNTARNVKKCFSTLPLEVYGSTETGGIAYRQQFNDTIPWCPFSGVSLVEEAGETLIRSPNMPNQGLYKLDDKIIILDDGCFLLQGRKDRIVKIEEKRISLNEIENFLTGQESIHQAAALVLEKGRMSNGGQGKTSNRKIIVCAIILKPVELNKFKPDDLPELIHIWKEAMRVRFELVAIPKKWRIVDTIPINTQGKIDTQKLLIKFQKTKKTH